MFWFAAFAALFSAVGVGAADVSEQRSDAAIALVGRNGSQTDAFRLLNSAQTWNNGAQISTTLAFGFALAPIAAPLGGGLATVLGGGRLAVAATSIAVGAGEKLTLDGLSVASGFDHGACSLYPLGHTTTLYSVARHIRFPSQSLPRHNR